MVSRNTWIVVVAAMAVSILAEFFVHGHGEHPWWLVKGFYAGFGFVCCALIIIISKFVGHAFLDRPETYYDPEEGEGSTTEGDHHG